MSAARREAVHGANFGVPGNPKFEKFQKPSETGTFSTGIKRVAA